MTFGFFSALLTFFFSGILRSVRIFSSEVIISRELELIMRSVTVFGEKSSKIIECIALMRA